MIPHRMAPGGGELAILSLLATRTSGGWQVLSGALLTSPREVALTSWKRWGWLTLRSVDPDAPVRRIEGGRSPWRGR